MCPHASLLFPPRKAKRGICTSTTSTTTRRRRRRIVRKRRRRRRRMAERGEEDEVEGGGNLVGCQRWCQRRWGDREGLSS